MYFIHTFFRIFSKMPVESHYHPHISSELSHIQRAIVQECRETVVIVLPRPEDSSDVIRINGFAPGVEAARRHIAKLVKQLSEVMLRQANV